MLTAPKFRRRKADRPTEIVQAALAVFAEKGFAGARLDEIAARAGVSKGALYLYFATKEEMFRAVVEQAVRPNLALVQNMATAEMPFPDLARTTARLMAHVAATSPLGGIVKMVIAEAGNFPELARIWYERTISPVLEVLVGVIARAQARGELRPGDPRQYALSLVAPTLVGVIWRDTFTPVGAPPFDLPALAEQHVETLLRGMMLEPTP